MEMMNSLIRVYLIGIPISASCITWEQHKNYVRRTDWLIGPLIGMVWPIYTTIVIGRHINKYNRISVRFD